MRDFSNNPSLFSSPVITCVNLLIAFKQKPRRTLVCDKKNNFSFNRKIFNVQSAKVFPLKSGVFPDKGINLTKEGV
jgi:hypothetical protein